MFADILLCIAYGTLMLSLVSNFVLVLATWNSPKLRSTCNRLIALNASFVVVSDLLVFEQFVVFPLFVPTPIAFQRCFWTILWPLMVGTTLLPLLMPLALAVERLLVVLFPIWAFQRDSRRYALLISLPVLLFEIGEVAYFGIQINTEVPNMPVACTLNDFLTFGSVAGYQGYFTIAVCWLIYATLWAVMRARKQNSAKVNAQQTLKRLARALLAIIVLDTVACCSGPISSLILTLTLGPQNPSVVPLSIDMAGVAINLSAALVTPTLYWINEDYRESVNKLFPKICRNSSTTPVSAVAAAVVVPGAGKGRVCGFGQRGVRRIGVDVDGRVDTEGGGRRLFHPVQRGYIGGHF